MRFLLLTPGASGKDGVSRLSRHTALALSEIEGGASVEVWSLHDEDVGLTELTGAGIAVRGAAGSKVRFSSWAVRRALRDCHGTSVVGMHAHVAPLGLPLRARGARVFHFLLGIEAWKPLTHLQAKAFHGADRLITISSHSANCFAEANPGFGEPRLCHPGLPTDGLVSSAGDDGFALMVGRMDSAERYKGHDLLLDAWSSVVDVVPMAKLVVVGDGDDRVRLIEKAASSGASGSVEFTGEVGDDELERLYRRCAFFIMPSRNEGFGLVFLEAMRAAKACIGGAGAAEEIIEHGKTGFVVDPGEPHAVVEAVVALFRDRDRRYAMGARGRERFEREFTSACFRKRLRASLDV